MMTKDGSNVVPVQQTQEQPSETGAGNGGFQRRFLQE